MIFWTTAAVFLITILFSLTAQTELSRHVLFNRNLQFAISHNKSYESIVYSPASIHGSLAFIYFVAEGQTADELSLVLNLDPESKKEFAVKYGKFLNAISSQLIMANRLYINSKINVSQQFNNTTQENFNSEVESVDFSPHSMIVKRINIWVSNQTNNKIIDILRPRRGDRNTNAVLVNGAYFKAKWLHPFRASNTRKQTFYLSDNRTVQVDTMTTDATFGYAELPDLKVTALEMPYENSNISMMILMPDEIGGLETLESHLKEIDLNIISSKMTRKIIRVFLPKFRIEYGIDLSESLKRMGLWSMFRKDANFSGIIKSVRPPVHLSIKHKAFIDVNENDSEAPAANNSSLSKPYEKLLRVDHPFAFFIRSKTVEYLAGHVVNFEWFPSNKY